MTATIQPDIDTARTIKAQIGLDTALAVSARKYAVGVNPKGETFLAFNFGKSGSNRWAKIAYVPGRDTYDIEFVRRNRRTYAETVDRTYADVYADSLGFLIRDYNNEVY